MFLKLHSLENFNELKNKTLSTLTLNNNQAIYIFNNIISY